MTKTEKILLPVTLLLLLVVLFLPADGKTLEAETVPAVRERTEAIVGGVDLNTASAEELKTLSGIGDTRAGDIIAYRESHGKFNSIEEIMLVPGIKEGAYAKICEDITV